MRRKMLLTFTSLLLAGGLVLSGCHSIPNHSFPPVSVSASGKSSIANGSKQYQVSMPVTTVVQNVLASHGKIRPHDYRFVRDGLKTKKFSAPNAAGALAALIGAKNLTKAQKLQVRDLCISLLPTQYPGDFRNEVKPRVITLLGLIGDKKAIPYLIPQLKAPEDTTRITAQGALQDLGYKTDLKKVLY